MPALFAAIAETQSLYLPVDTAAGTAKFDRWQEGTTLSEKLKTTKSAKDFFFPKTETLVEFRKNGANLEIEDPRRETEDFVLFGVRSCDARSFSILDRVFLAEPVDTYYQNRRRHGTIVTLACARPEETCFCTAFGIDPTAPEGDVAAWLTEDALYLDAQTEKGEKLLASVAPLTEEADGAAVEAQNRAVKAILERLPNKDLPLDRFGAGTTETHFRSEKWTSLSEACLGCGTCTFNCPTCQCYDIRDFDTGHGVRRFRCWDSCMFSDFTKMASGNPRLTQKERFRQRFLHKLVYFPENNDGVFGCVGCGRCVEKCPMGLNIVRVIKALGEEETK